MGFKDLEVALPQHQRQKHQSGNENSEPSGGQGTKFCGAHAHE